MDHRLHQPGHAFIEIAGIRFDTSAEQDATWVAIPAGCGPRWRPLVTSSTGFMARHPTGLQPSPIGL